MTAATSFSGFLSQVVIDSRPDPKRFDLIADPWQWDMAHQYQAALEDIAGVRPGYLGPRSFWQGMPRGHDKTSAIARAACWVLAFSKRPISGIVAAADEDQAGFIIDAMKATVSLNPWLAEVVVGAKKAVGPGGKVQVITADAPSAFGATNDLFILDELTHWKKRDLWNAIWSGRIKRPNAVAIVITNAGILRTWQDEVHQEAQRRHGKDWSVFDLPPRQKWSSWMRQADWDGLRSFLTKGEAKRVLDNEWIDMNEDSGWVTYAEAKACEDDSIPLFVPKREKGKLYKAGIDYGPKKDRTALCVLHAEGVKDAGSTLDYIQIDRLDVWQGSAENRIKIIDVERWIDEMIELFNCDLVVDPYQMEGTIQKYEHRRKVTRFEPRGGKANYELAECLRHLVVNRKLRYHPSAGTLSKPGGGVECLTDELSQLVVKPTQYGYRIEHHLLRANQPPQFVCHDDRAVALGMPALEAVRDFTGGAWLPPPVVGGVGNPSPTVDRSKIRELLERFDPKRNLPARPLLGVGRFDVRGR